MNAFCLILLLLFVALYEAKNSAGPLSSTTSFLAAAGSDDEGRFGELFQGRLKLYLDRVGDDWGVGIVSYPKLYLDRVGDDWGVGIVGV